MPYFIYKITSGSAGDIKNLEFLEKYEEFKQAKKIIREKREEIGMDDRVSVKMIFAETEFEAEERLSHNRQAPILREWEK